MIEPHDMIDRSLKVLVRHAPYAFLQLAGITAPPNAVTVSDPVLAIPELRGDKIILIGHPDDPDRWGWYLEFVLQPDRRPIPVWQVKQGGFRRQLDIPVLLTAVYLTEGDRANFPDRDTIERGGRSNAFIFDTLHLWEHADAIRSGELAELAPLLVLCEEMPTEATLREERELILELDVPRAVRADMLAVAVMAGTRYFARDLLMNVFREELFMWKDASFIQDWIEEGIAERAPELRAQGRGEGARELLLRLLRGRFGELPAAVIARVEAGDAEWCGEIAERLMGAASLTELGLVE